MQGLVGRNLVHCHYATGIKIPVDAGVNRLGPGLRRLNAAQHKMVRPSNE